MRASTLSKTGSLGCNKDENDVCLYIYIFYYSFFIIVVVVVYFSLVFFFNFFLFNAFLIVFIF